jgi:hypothetical protein
MYAYSRRGQESLARKVTTVFVKQGHYNIAQTSTGNRSNLEPQLRSKTLKGLRVAGSLISVVFSRREFPDLLFPNLVRLLPGAKPISRFFHWKDFIFGKDFPSISVRSWATVLYFDSKTICDR